MRSKSGLQTENKHICIDATNECKLINLLRREIVQTRVYNMQTLSITLMNACTIEFDRTEKIQWTPFAVENEKKGLIFCKFLKKKEKNQPQKEW